MSTLTVRTWSLADIVFFSYDFGDSNGTAAGQPYMQLLAQTDPANATAQVASIRNRTMANLPPEIEPGKLVELLKAEDPTIRTATSPAPPCNCSATVAPLPISTLSKRQLSPTQERPSSTDRYGPVIVGLLAVNAVIGVVLLVLAVVDLMQRQALARRPTRSGPHYVSVKSHATEGEGVRSNRRHEDQLSTTGYSQLSV